MREGIFLRVYDTVEQPDTEVGHAIAKVAGAIPPWQHSAYSSYVRWSERRRRACVVLYCEKEGTLLLFSRPMPEGFAPRTPFKRRTFQ